MASEILVSVETPIVCESFGAPAHESVLLFVNKSQ